MRSDSPSGRLDGLLGQVSADKENSKRIKVGCTRVHALVAPLLHRSNWQECRHGRGRVRDQVRLPW